MGWQDDDPRVLSFRGSSQPSHETRCASTGLWEGRGAGELQRGHSVPALIPESPGHGPDLHILYPKVVSEGSTLWGSAGLTALQDT